jgi:16S rRNA (guanine966-N2)-methyltransferase
MRIISGCYKGKKLFTPSDDRIRPTSDRAREAIFNILFSSLDRPFSECRVLDVFSGSGALGIEAISRGAIEALFVDIDLSLTKKNVLNVGAKNVSFIERDARKLPTSLKKFDLVFMDAPYNKGLSEPSLSNLLEKGYLSDDAILVVEVARDEELVFSDEFRVLDTRVYGACKILILSINHGEA